MIDRRAWLGFASAGLLAWPGLDGRAADETVPALGDAGNQRRQLLIKSVKITPIALPDPPLLSASGCHGPYFLRNIVQLETDAGIVGVGETKGGELVTADLEKARELVVGQNPFAYRSFAGKVLALNPACYAGIELACLDACGQALGQRLCDLLGGPVRNDVEFAAYLFFRYAADHPQVLADKRIVDDRGAGDKALDAWGDVRSAEKMAELAVQFRQQFGFRVFKLKAGVLQPEVELQALTAINARFEGKYRLRIDPNARWTVPTAVRMAKELRALPMEYYEDPVEGQEAMAQVRKQTGLPMSTNMCVTRFEHIPEAVRMEPIDVVLCDHHNWSGITGCQALGTMAEALKWKVSQHSNNHAGVTMAAMTHVGAVVPQLTVASDTHYPWLPNGADIIEGGKLQFVEGRMTVPPAPGMGVRLDLDKLARAHEVYTRCGMRARDDANTMRQMVPNWVRTLF